MLRLFGEPEANERAFDALDAVPRRARRDAAARRRRPGVDPLALSFQLKLLWLSGYLPHVTSCVECGAATSSSASRRARAAPSAARTRAARFALSPEGLAGIEQLLSTPLADAAAAELGGSRPPRGARRRHLVLRGARRLPPADALGMKRELGDGFELDDDKARIDRRRGAPVPLRGDLLGRGPRVRDAGRA